MGFSRKIKKLIYSIKDNILELYFLSGLNKAKFQKMLQDRLTPEMEKFINVNKKYWASIQGSSKKERILVEGQLAGYGPNYLLRISMIAKAIEQKTGCIPIVVIENPAYRSSVRVESLKSFNINQFVFLRNNPLFIYYKAKAILASLLFYLKNNLQTLRTML